MIPKHEQYQSVIEGARGTHYPLAAMYQWQYENQGCWDCRSPHELFDLLIAHLRISDYEMERPVGLYAVIDSMDEGSEEAQYLIGQASNLSTGGTKLHEVYTAVAAVLRTPDKYGSYDTDQLDRIWSSIWQAMREGTVTWPEAMGCAYALLGITILSTSDL